MSALQQALMSIYGSVVAGGGGGGFTPATLFAASEQGVWFDPSDFSSMFQDTAGATPVTATGQAVARINDKSGRGNHATQATASARPLLQIDGGGKYYLAFDGVDDYLSTAAINLSATNKINRVIGFNTAGTAFCFLTCFSTDHRSTDGTFEHGLNVVSSGDDYLSLRGSGTYEDSWTATKTLPRKNVVTVQHDMTASTSLLRTLVRNNAASATTSPGGGPTTAGNFGNFPLFIGIRGSLSFPFNGAIYSYILRGAASTSTEITDTETYVNGKTGAF